MSEDKIKQKQVPSQPLKEEVQVVYEEFQISKYGDWKDKTEKSRPIYPPKPQPEEHDKPVTTDVRGNEQKAFENYLAEQDIYKAPKAYVWKDIEDKNECLTQGNGMYRCGEDTKNKPFNSKSGVVEILFENPNRSLAEHTQFVQRYTDIATSTTYVRTYGYFHTSKKFTEWKPMGGGSLPAGLKPIKFLELKDNKTFDYLKERANNDNKDIIVTNTDGLETGDIVIINAKEGKITDNSNLSMLIFGEIKTKSPAQGQIYINGKGYSTGYLPTGAGPSPQPQPGGGGRPVIVIPDDTNPTIIAGDYGFNFFNYRDLTTNTKIGVNGMKFYNKEDIQVGSVDNHSPKHIRIRAKDTINFLYRVNKTNSKTSTSFKIYPTQSRGNVIALDFNTRSGSDKLKQYKKYNNTPDQFSYASYNLGGIDSPCSTDMDIKAWYGNIQPTVLDQSFVFKTYNNIKLMALQTYEPTQGTKQALLKDEYKIYNRKTTIAKKVNVFKLKDAKEYFFGQVQDNLHLLIPVPDDCKVESSHMMSNNLCDISAVESEQALPNEKRPFFVRQCTEGDFKGFHYDETTHEIIRDISGRPEIVDIQKQCFTIMISHDNIGEWKSLLEKTQIAYEVKDEIQHEEIMLPVGGQTFVLSDGTNINTCMYKTIKAGDKSQGSNKYIIHFEDSPFGYPNIRIMIDEIVEIIDNTCNTQAP